MNNNDEVLTTAYTSLGMMRAGLKSFESADPMSPEARPLWHEALKLMGQAVSKQWAYTDVLMKGCKPDSANPQQPTGDSK